jgi:septum formation protein
VPPPPRLILASASPQRSAILAGVGIPFKACPMDVEELTHGDPAEVAAENARRKALAAARHGDRRAADRREFGSAPIAPRRPPEAELPGSSPPGEPPILGADTLVTIDGDILGKPADHRQAREYVARLAGRAHRVVGAIALVEDGEVVQSAVEVTEVRFRALEPPLLDWYVATGEWRDRAGGYAIQGAGAALVERVDGDPTTVVGLPVGRLLALLEDAGLAPWSR